MLPAAARLTKSQEFRLVVRRGRRAGRARLVVHLLPPDSAARAELGTGRSYRTRRPGSPKSTGRERSAEIAGTDSPRATHDRGEPTGTKPERAVSASRPEPGADTAPTRGPGEPARVGFVVSKAVGNAVLRHRVARRLRHLMRDRLAQLPAGTLVVVRALPPAATATSRDLGADLDAALRKLRVGPGNGGPVNGPV